MGSKVQKMLGAEEKTMISNIQSILSELLASEEGSPSGEDTMPGEVAMAEDTVMPEDQETPEEKEVKMIIKGIETTPSDSATASDDAETLLEEPQTDETKDNVQEVAKALLLALSNVKKSAPKKEVDPVTQILSQMVQVQKSTQSQVNELTEVITNVLDGMGIVDQLRVEKSKVVPKVQPNNDLQNQEVLEQIQKALGISSNQENQLTSSRVHKANRDIVRKNLGNAQVLAGLLGRKI